MTHAEFRVRASPEAPSISRSRVAEIRPLLEPRFDDVAIVISELVSNSVKHAEPTEQVRVVIETTRKTVRLRVTDQGPCFRADEKQSDGIGLRIVDRIAERWGVDNDEACTVWVELTKTEPGSRTG